LVRVSAYGGGSQMKYIVYVLKSIKTNKKYVGYTSDIKRRLSEHNRSNTFFDRINKPFEIIYTETFYSKVDATKREKYLKSGIGRKELKKIQITKCPASSVG
jgi:putative endonuclease